MSAKTFFKQRMAHDIVYAYYAHPTAWNEIGWGGPASPRGYVRMGYNERDPWEAAEVKGAMDPARWPTLVHKKIGILSPCWRRGSSLLRRAHRACRLGVASQAAS